MWLYSRLQLYIDELNNIVQLSRDNTVGQNGENVTAQLCCVVHGYTVIVYITLIQW